MKTIKLKTYTFLFALFFLLSCDRLDVLENEVAISEEDLLNPVGIVGSVASMLKNGFEGHQNIMWCASLIGQEELKSTGSATQFPFANQIATTNTVASDNTQNNTNMRFVYRTFEFARIARKGIDVSEFVSDAGQNQKAKDILLANIKFMEALMYADMAKFYEAVPEPETSVKLTPDEAKGRAIALLTEARGHFQAFSANPAAVVSVNGVPITTGILGNTGLSGEKLCNSMIGMIYFDQGPRSSASAFLSLGYVAADAANQATYRVINALTGAGIYPLPINYVSFQLNDYSDSFVAQRIPLDEVRRGAAIQWYNSSVPLSSRMSYFFPTVPVAPATTVRYPIISWQEVALMRVELGELAHAATVQSVVQSWGVPTATAMMVAGDLINYPLSRIARYEYMYRGRRWSQVNNATPNTYPRWQLSVNFNFN